MSDLTIALSGLSDSDAAAIDAAVDSLPRGTWQTVNATPATLLVVDIDTTWGHMDWLRATADGQQVVALTQEPQVRNCNLVLHKPLQPRELKRLLAGLASTRAADGAHDASAQPVPGRSITAAATPPAVPEREHVAVEPAMPTPESRPTTMLSQCLLAGDIRQPVTIHGPDGTRLTLDPERGGYTGPSLLKPLQPLLRMPMSQATPLDPPTIELMRQAPALPLTRLLWFAALTATPGQLASALDAQASYHLARWPQIEREFPRHFRIATAMMKGPGTLDAIASTANAPVGDVADFINAYSVAGYVSCRNGPDTEPPAPSGGVFSRLRRPFSRSGQERA